MGCTAERTDQTASLVRMADAQQLSQAAFDRLKAEYDDLTTRGRIDIARKIEAARELVVRRRGVRRAEHHLASRAGQRRAGPCRSAPHGGTRGNRGDRRSQRTASGGAFRDWQAADLENATVADATSHPNWSMGRKITVDSASLMNKGLEVIEAHYLFGLDYDHIEIVIHPQSIIHSMIELADSSVLAQLGWPDMKLPILYCLSWPSRLETPWRRLDLTEVGQLSFRAPDPAKYPCMELAYAAGRAGGTMPAVMNAANEEAVAQFLEEKIHFLDIPTVIEAACERHKPDLMAQPQLDDVLRVDQWARTAVREQVNRGVTRLPMGAIAA